jgi:hypothetical protein
MKLTIEINGDNAAFYNEDETVNSAEYKRILNYLAGALEHHLNEPQEEKIRDINGNICGIIKIENLSTKPCHYCQGEGKLYLPNEYSTPRKRRKY